MATPHPITREQLDAFVAEMLDMARDRGRAAEAAARQAGWRPTFTPTTAQLDMKARAGLVLERDLWASLVRDLDEVGRLAVAERDELVAEAEFILEGRDDLAPPWDDED